MRKQTDFAVRVWKLTNNPNEGTLPEQLTKEIREDYLAKGYEVFDTSAIQVSGFAIMYHVAFVKWEEVAQEPNVKSK